MTLLFIFVCTIGVLNANIRTPSLNVEYMICILWLVRACIFHSFQTVKTVHKTNPSFTELQCVVGPIRILCLWDIMNALCKLGCKEWRMHIVHVFPLLKCMTSFAKHKLKDKINKNFKTTTAKH